LGWIWSSDCGLNGSGTGSASWPGSLTGSGWKVSMKYCSKDRILSFRLFNESSHAAGFIGHLD
jgi:hypothetical protein